MLSGGRRPVGGGGNGTPHGESLSRNQLLGRRNGNSLEVGVTYVIPYNRGTVGAAEIALVATATNELSKGGWVNVSFDNSAWECDYDIDTNRITAMRDNRDNEVRGQNIVDTFPWGMTAVNRNTVNNAATLNYTAGNFNDNVIDSGAVINATSGNFERNKIGQLANVTIDGTDFRNNIVENDATINSTSTGDIEQNTFGNLCNVTASGTSNIDECSISGDANVTLSNAGSIIEVSVQKGTLNVTGGSLQYSEVGNNSTVTISSGSNIGNTFGNDTTYNQAGTGTIRYSKLRGNSSWTNGNTNIEDVDCWNTSVNTTGSSGTIYYSRFHNSSLSGLTNVASLTIQYSSVENNSSFSANNATRVYFYQSQLVNFGRIIQSAGTQLDCAYTGCRDYGYIQVTAGRLYANYCTVANVSYVQHTSTGTNRIERTQVLTQSRALFNNTATGCRIYYCQITSGAYMQHRNASVNCYIYYSTASDQSQLYTRDSTNARIYYCSATGAGILYSQGNTTTHYIYYCTATARGYVVALNNTAVVRLYSLHASSVAQIRLQNTAANSNLYYSSVAAYYYAYITLTGGTRSALHGYGRRSYTVTNPPNGSYVQNF